MRRLICRLMFLIEDLMDLFPFLRDRFYPSAKWEDWSGHYPIDEDNI